MLAICPTGEVLQSTAELIAKFENRSAEEVAHAAYRITSTIAVWLRSLDSDNYKAMVKQILIKTDNL